MIEPWAIYRRPGRYVVKRFEEGAAGLWAALGPWYDREKAQKLADSLTRELEEERAKRPRRTRATVETPAHGSAAPRG